MKRSSFFWIVFLFTFVYPTHMHASTLTISEILDGRTVKLSDGRTVRLIGVECVDDTGAADFLKKWVLDKPVWAQMDPAYELVQHHDGEGHFLAYVRLLAGSLPDDMSQRFYELVYGWDEGSLRDWSGDFLLQHLLIVEKLCTTTKDITFQFKSSFLKLEERAQKDEPGNKS